MSQTEIAQQYFFGKRWKLRICPTGSLNLTVDICKIKTNFSKIPLKTFSGLENLAIEVNSSQHFG